MADVFSGAGPGMALRCPECGLTGTIRGQAVGYRPGPVENSRAFRFHDHSEISGTFSQRAALRLLDIPAADHHRCPVEPRTDQLAGAKNDGLLDAGIGAGPLGSAVRHLSYLGRNERLPGHKP